MALTYTPPGELGSLCPDFHLPSVDGKLYDLSSFASSPILLVMFICNHCPYVQAVESRLIRLARDLRAKNVAVVGICSNDASEYPEDAPSELLKRWQNQNYGFPYLVDASQDVARQFGAVCTPDFFVYDDQRRLRYRGRLDDSWRAPEKVKNQELRQAIESLLGGQELNALQNPSMGCSIKWKTGD